jgi:[CysO sulfur-carrier protein]-S-L-cysteine hydrolase
MISQLFIKRPHWEKMIRHVEENAPFEACGLLAGKDDRVEEVLLVRNQAKSPVRFVMDPYQQLEAFEWIESHALDLIGIFHSHPAGPETASATDIAEAAYDAVSVIWSRPQGQWQARGFWITDGQAINIPLVLSTE